MTVLSVGYMNNQQGNVSIVGTFLIENHMYGLVVKHSCLQIHSCFLFLKSAQTQNCVKSIESPLASSVETIIYFCNKSYVHITTAEEYVQEWELQ